MKKIIILPVLLIAFFTFLQKVEAASIDSISPNVIVPGSTTITITGHGFGDSSLYSYIYFGNTRAYSLSWSDTTITVKAPSYFYENKGLLEISGSFKTGQSCYGSYCYDTTEYQTLNGGYFYIKPQITNISPSQGVAGNLVKITGQYFGSSQGQIKFGSQQARIISWSNTSITVEVPENGSGNISITIENVASASAGFQYLELLSSDGLSGYQTYLKQIGIDQAWRIQSKGSSAVIVAVLDEGVYENHPDLINNMWRNTKEVNSDKKDNDGNGYVDDFYGWNFVDNNSNLTTKGDHGTMVAGIIGATKDNGIGIAGIASGVKILPVIVCDKNGCTDEAVIKGIKYAVDMGANIINLSLGGRGTLGYSSSYDEIVKYAYDHDVLIVAAAGNGDIESQTTYAGALGQNLNYIKASPVCNNGEYNYVLGVGAVDKNNSMTSWTNYGTDCVDIWAPGTNIYSTSVALYSDYDYKEADGTSFSAPIISGIAALMKSKNPTLKNWEIMSRIISSGAASSGIVNATSALADYNTNINAKLTSISPTTVNQGESFYVYGTGFASNLTFRLIGPSVSWVVPSANINFKSGSVAKITIPQNILSAGLYSINLNLNSSVLAQLNNILTITSLNSVNGISNNSSDNTDKKVENTNINNDASQSSNNNVKGNLIGYILLQVESHGEAWYVNPADGKRYYMKDGPTAYEMMRKFGLGITDTDLAKIPEENGKNNNPTLVNKLKGKILLQVQQHGEAWYINPKTGYRYYMKDGEAAYSLMRFHSLGITNKDLEKIPIGTL